jgi:beta-lactamase regulating signal transducer with metallopeptidase domain
MSAAAALEVWISLVLQVAILAAVTAWIERHVDREGSSDHLWAAFHVIVLALSVAAWLVPHVRIIQPRLLLGSVNVDRLAAIEERTAVIVLAVWACGAAVSVAALAFGMWNSWQMIRLSRPVDPNLHRKLLSSVYGDASGVELRITPLPVTPFCWQFSRPKVVLPEYLLEAPPEIIRPIINHELTHLSAGHPLQMFLQRLVEIVYWHHPIVWITSRRAAIQREWFADGGAVKSREDAVQFLKGLLHIAQFWSDGLRLPAGLAFGASPSQIEARAQRLVDRAEAPLQSKRCRLPTLRLAAAAMLCLAVWPPVNLLASARGAWSPWPRWTAAALQEVGVEVRDYEIDAHRLLPHDHARTANIE